MRFGLMLGEKAEGIHSVEAEIKRAAVAGLSSAWMSQIFGYDAITALAVAGRGVPGIELGTGVIPTYPRHPVVMASQALTAQAALDGRFVLGIGLSHQIVIEGMYGYSFDQPVRHMSEYLSILAPLIREGKVSFRGETLRWEGALDIPGSRPCPILVAALGPRMLRLAGEVADGTVTWMTGAATVEAHIVPTITEAAERVGRPRPRVAVALPVCVTNDAEAARQRAGQMFSIYGQLPSYRAMLDREGAGGPQDVAVVGSEEEVTRQLARVADAGASDMIAGIFGSRPERDRTLELISSLAAG